ncbi:MAG: stage 0 sporulation family protein [Anaerolineae bacterium]|nr:stage 0 sporulation family protein [Anaerolineae bacterium]
MPIVCGIKFRRGGKVYYFSPGDIPDLQVGDHVIVETAKGKELGQVVIAPKEVDESELVGELKPILHRATQLELLEAERYKHQEPEAMAKCKEQVAKFQLPMKIVGAEYSYDGSRLTFFFTAEQRVDFRELVRELAKIFRTRIELRQIGVRDEAKLLGGLGKCGRPLCCATWLTEFNPVSIRMAKQQDLPLSPMEISGLCGRLLCCLVYENDFYQEVKSKFPKVGKMVNTPYGPGKVIKVSVFKETVSILLEDGSTLELTAEELEELAKRAAEPQPVAEATPSPSEEQGTAATPTVGVSVSPAPSEDLSQAQPTREPEKEQSKAKARRRPRRRPRRRIRRKTKGAENASNRGNNNRRGNAQAKRNSRQKKNSSERG